MCLILVAWQAHPDYPCLLAANRDEFHARVAAPLHWWRDAPQLLAGRDLQAGGTWLGITRGGRFAALTNYRDPTRHRADAPSRGALVSELLLRNDAVPDCLQSLDARAGQYNGFNLLVGDGAQLYSYESVTRRRQLLPPGVYGLSNHLLDTPWPKLRQARSRLAAALGELPIDAPLLDLLRDRTPARDEELPRTGVSLEWERLLSSAFICAPDYGTRCSTILLIDRSGGARIDEWTWNERGAQVGHQRHEFRLPEARTSSG